MAYENPVRTTKIRYPLQHNHAVKEQISNNYLKLLENSLRLNSAGTQWIVLEPLDNLLLDELRKLNDCDSHLKIPCQLSKPKQSQSIPVTRVEEEKKLPSPQPEPSEAPPPSVNNEPDCLTFDNVTNLDSLHLKIIDCDGCQLCLGRKSIVFGQGNQTADLVFIGEGPGADEDKIGLAFVGKAGKLLTQIIQSIGIHRQSVYICNVVKCRPPGNRNPTAEEIENCSPILFKQLEILKPKLIVTLGNIATKTLLPNAAGIMRMRGKLNHFNDIPLIPTYHPSFLLRNQSAIPDVWEDMRYIRQFLFRSRPTPPTENHPSEKETPHDPSKSR